LALAHFICHGISTRHIRRRSDDFEDAQDFDFAQLLTTFTLSPQFCPKNLC